jgi:uncharacterized membrane protein HdeD (DUF308 family)
MNPYQEEEQRKTARVRSIMDFAMGILLILFGVYFFAYRHLGINLFQREPSGIDYLIGAVFCLYGGWRIFRGYKKLSNK